MQTPTLYTIGHGNRSIGELISLLQERNIQALVDIRAQPHSRRFPHFSMDPLRESLDSAGIQYHWAGRHLGGRRTAQTDSSHQALQEGLRGYADHMLTDTFHKAATQLVNMAAKTNLAILCAERLPQDCHRRLIADYLTLQGVEVIHLIAENESRPHQLSPEARRESAQLIYDRNISGELDL